MNFWPFYNFLISFLISKFILKNEPVGFLINRNPLEASKALKQIFLMEKSYEIHQRYQEMNESNLFLCCRGHDA
jgi:hypothetical protein